VADALLRADVASTASTALGDALVGVKSTLTGAVATTQHEVNSRAVNVFDFLSSAQKADVIAGTAALDVRSALADAVAAARGKKLTFPEGQYLINTDGGSITLEEVTLQGEMVLDGATASLDQGAVFRFTGTTNSPFKIKRGVTIDGLGFYYPNQTDTATPTAYPVMLDFDYSGGAVQFVYIQNNVVYNAYRWIDMADSSGDVGHIWITDNTVCALNRGVYVRHNLEHIRVSRNNFTFGHWLASTEGGARAYVRANCAYLQVDQSDGIELIDNLMFGSLYGGLYAASGLTQMQTISLNKMDQVRYPVRATGTGNFDGTITANIFNAFNSQDTTAQGRAVWVNTSGSAREMLIITNNTFKVATEEAMVFANGTPTRDVVVSGNTCLSWAAYKAAGSYFAMSINGALGNFLISSNYFYGGNSTAYSGGIGGTTNSVYLHGNVFETMQTPISITTTNATVSNNTSTGTAGSLTDQVFCTAAVIFGNNFDKPNFPLIKVPIASVENFANDAAAAAGNVEVGGWYRNGSVLMIRVS